MRRPGVSSAVTAVPGTPANLHFYRMRILPAFRRLPARSLAALARFPIVLLAGAFLTWTIAWEPFGGGGESERLLIVALIGIIIAYDATLLKERLGLRNSIGHLGVAIVTSVVLLALWWSIDLIASQNGSTPPYDVFVAEDEPVRIAALALALHALAATIPFFGRGRLAGFWDYNRTLFVRVLSSALFSGVLYLGLAVALWAIDELLTIDIHDDNYTNLFAFMLGVVNTWFFLAGVPMIERDGATRVFVQDDGDLGKPDTTAITGNPVADEGEVDAEYPRGLKVFVQFVLLPLTVVYLIILYLYVARITIEWTLPEGQVSYLIFGYAVIGMLAYLLIYPLRDDAANLWIRRYARGFFTALAPLLIVLVIALLRRTSDYGITEPRYYGVALAIWLALVVAYFLSRREDIRIIPSTLAAVALLTTFGPWSATSVSIRSQIAQLSRRAAVASPSDPNGDQANSVRSITQYLHQRGRLAEAAAGRTSRPDTVDTPSELTELYGVDAGWQAPSHHGLHFAFTPPPVLDVESFSEVITIESMGRTRSYHSQRFGNITIELRRPGVLHVRTADDSVSWSLHTLADSLNRTTIAPDHGESRSRPRRAEYAPPSPALAGAGSRLRARLVLQWMTGGWTSADVATVSDAAGILLLGPLQSPNSRDTNQDR